MIDKAKAELVIAEVAEVCRKHGVFLIGVAHSEGQYAEIVISDEMSDERNVKPNELSVIYDDEPTVSVIG
jgi:hypothetical protein